MNVLDVLGMAGAIVVTLLLWAVLILIGDRILRQAERILRQVIR